MTDYTEWGREVKAKFSGMTTLSYFNKIVLIEKKLATFVRTKVDSSSYYFW